MLWDWIAWLSSDGVPREACVHDMLVLLKEGDFGRTGTNTGFLGQVVKGIGDHRNADSVHLLMRTA